MTVEFLWDDLPPPWNCCVNNDGRVFFIKWVYILLTVLVLVLFFNFEFAHMIDYQYFNYDMMITVLLTYCVTSGPHAVSTIVKCLQSQGCC